MGVGPYKPRTGRTGHTPFKNSLYSLYKMCNNGCQEATLSSFLGSLSAREFNAGVWWLVCCEFYLTCKISLYYVRLIEQGLTSHQTHYRSYRGRFFQIIWPNQQCQSAEGNQLVLQIRLESHHHQDHYTQETKDFHLAVSDYMGLVRGLYHPLDVDLTRMGFSVFTLPYPQYLLVHLRPFLIMAMAYCCTATLHVYKQKTLVTLTRNGR